MGSSGFVSNGRVAPPDLAREPDLECFAGICGGRIKVEALSAERADPPPYANKRRVTVQRRFNRENIKSRDVMCAISALKDNLERGLDHARLSPTSGARVQFIG